MQSLPFQTNPINQTKEWSDFKGACTFDRGVSYFLEKASTCVRVWCVAPSGFAL